MVFGRHKSVSIQNLRGNYGGLVKIISMDKLMGFDVKLTNLLNNIRYKKVYVNDRTLVRLDFGKALFLFEIFLLIF
jgi:hypothetical protein